MTPKQFLPLWVVSAMAVSTAHGARFAVDFNGVDADGFPVGGSLNEVGYEPFDLQHETLDQEFSVERTESFNTPFGSLDFTLSTNKDNEAADANQVPQSIVRGSGFFGNYDGELIDLAMDWTGIDSRRAGATSFSITIGGLPSGNYDFLSYHQDIQNQTGQFSVSVDGVVVHEEVDIWDSQSGQNPGAGNPPFSVITPITSDGSDVEITFDLLTAESANVVERFFVINGFILADEGEASIINSFSASPLEVFRGETVTLEWSVAPGATVEIDPELGDVTDSTTDGVGTATVEPDDTTDYLLLVETDDVDEERTITITVKEDIQAFSADSSSILLGTSTVLTWAVNPRASVEIDPIGDVTDLTDENGFGSVEISPDETTEYFLTTRFDGDSTNAELEVSVLDLGEESTLGDGLVAYWPLDEVQGTRTPDLANGLDLDLRNMDESNVVEGRWGNAFSFDNSEQTILTRVHEDGEALPANQYESFTVSFWALVEGQGQNDLRMFSEGSTTDGNPLFNIGTHNGGADGTVDIFIRNGGTEVGHAHSEADVLDGENWAHVVFVQEDRERRLYINGELDNVALSAQPDDVTFDVNNTSVGGILRSDLCCLVTGLIDEVAIWDRNLTDEEISELNVRNMEGVFDPLTQGLVAHWPLDEVRGTRTPDIVNGYDMDLRNMSADNVVDGKIGNAFSFDNAQQTILTRVHADGEDLPAQQHESFTVSFWANVNFEGQNDLRVFSEGSTTDGNPLFNIGTHNGGADGSVDIFIRNGPTEVNHAHSEALPFDGQDWHHIVFVEEAGVRTLYIDGERDSISDSIADRASEIFPVNNTSIGGILRSDTCCLVTGLIDEVAIWKRPLDSSEVQRLNVIGVPEVRKPALPLEIRGFSADFATVVSGDTATLRWDTNADATVTIDQGVGDVTALSDFGVGSVDVPVAAPTVFVLTVSRGDESLQAQVAVDIVGADVAPGWRALETFEGYPAGSIDNLGGWINPEGVVTVVDLGANNVLGFEGGNSLNALLLESLSMPVGAMNTYFVRFYISPNDSSSLIDAHFGITERPIRFSGDFNNNVGPFIALERPDGGEITLSARNGVGAAIEPLDYEVEAGVVYNVWFDITNELVEDGDVYSVYIQAEGEAERTLIIDGYIADRDAAVDPFFGPPGADLVTAFFSLDPGAQGSENLLFDDLFISADGFLDTVPVPASNFTFQAAPMDPIVVSGALDANGFSLTWNSEIGDSYTIWGSNDLIEWVELAVGFPDGGASSVFTTWTDADTSAMMEFYQVAFVPPPSLFEDDFESGASGWDTVTNEGHNGSTRWELGAPTSGPGSATSPENAYGTNLDGFFDEETDVSLISPVIDLTNETSATLTFQSFVEIEESADGEFDNVSVSVLAEDGTVLSENFWLSGTNTGGWSSVAVDLPAEAFGQPIRLAFRMFEDGFLVDDEPSQAGWYIDDVRLEN